MFFFLIFNCKSASNFQTFKVDDAKVCPANVENSVTDLNSELSGTTQTKLTVYVGKSDLTVKQSEIGTKDVTFIGCNNEISLNINLDQQINTIHGENIKLNYQTSEKPVYEALSLSKSQISASPNPLEFETSTLTTDLYSAKSSGVSSFTTKKLQFSETSDFSGISLSNGQIQISDSSSSKPIKYTESAEIEFTTKGTIEITVSSLSKPITLLPQTNGTTLFFSSYDSSINQITINNDDITELTLTTPDTNNLKVQFTNSKNEVTINEYLPPGDDSLNVGQIIGIVIAVILCVLAVLACVFITKCEAKEAAESEVPLKSASNRDEDEHSL